MKVETRVETRVDTHVDTKVETRVTAEPRGPCPTCGQWGCAWEKPDWRYQQDLFFLELKKLTREPKP